MRRAARLGWLLALLPALAGLVAGPARPAAAAPTPAPDPSASAEPHTLPFTLELLTLTPTAPQPGDTVTVRVRVTNTARSTATDVHAELRLGSYLGNRSVLAAFTEGGDRYLDSRVVDGGVAVNPATLRPGQQGTVTLHLDLGTVSLRAGGFGGAGVYELGVTARGTLDGEPQPLARLRTLLPYAPVDRLPQPIRLAWMWPLVDRPHRAGSDTFRDDTLAVGLRSGRLATLLAAGGTAARTPVHPPAPAPTASPTAGSPAGHAGPGSPVAAGRTVPVTWVVDPMLLADATAMAGGYQVRGTGTQTHPGAGRDAARVWLDSARHVLGGADTIVLPYADPDLTALVHAGLADQVRTAEQVGADQARATLGAGPTTTVQWPPDGRVDEQTLERLAGTGTQAVVLSDRNLPTAEELTYTPTAHVRVAVPSGTVDAVLTDSTLTDIVMDGARDPAHGARAEQRFLAETLLIALERPGERRDIVVAPDRRWAPSADYAAQLLADTGRAPWLQPVTVADVRADPVADIDRGRLVYPPDVAGLELPAGYLADVATLRRRFLAFRSVLARPDGALASGLQLGLLRTVSSAYRDDHAAGQALRTAVAADLHAAVDAVSTISSGLVTLTSDSGTVPITVANSLDQPVHVVLHLDAGPQATVAEGGRIPLTLPAHQTSTRYVRTSTKVAGVFRLQAWLTPTDSNLVLGGTATLRVRSTVYGTVAIGITAGALAVLFVAVGFRLVRRALRARRSAGTAG